MVITLELYSPLFWVLVSILYLLIGIVAGRLCYKYNWLGAPCDEDQGVVAALMIIFWPIAAIVFCCFGILVAVFYPLIIVCTEGVEKK